MNDFGDKGMASIGTGIMKHSKSLVDLTLCKA